MDPEIDALARAAKRARRLPPDARCVECGEHRFLKVAPDGVTRCYACRRAAVTDRAFEADHLAGVANWGSLTVRLRPNDHRAVEELRSQFGMDDWPDADGDPLLTLAHFIGGLAGLMVLVARWLVDLAVYLARSPSSPWFTAAPVAPIVP